MKEVPTLQIKRHDHDIIELIPSMRFKRLAWGKAFDIINNLMIVLKQRFVPGCPYLILVNCSLLDQVGSNTLYLLLRLSSLTTQEDSFGEIHPVSCSKHTLDMLKKIDPEGMWPIDPSVEDAITTFEQHVLT